MKTRTLTAIIIIGGVLLNTNVLLACTYPEAILEGSPEKTFVGQEVSLDGRLSEGDPGYPIVQYRWWFDYVNNPQSMVLGESTATHIYQTPGIYTITLQVKNSIWLYSPITPASQFTIQVNKIIYVDENAAGNNDGSSWNNAFNHLQDALYEATSGDQIWVAQGTYKPDQGGGKTLGDRYATFQLINGVEIYGGFSGIETSLDQRNWQLYPTILSGDLAGNDIHSDDSSANENTYNVVRASIVDSNTVLDGFTITGGNANVSYPYDRGGGMFNSGNSTVRNCLFIGNRAWNYGGGVYNINSEPNFINCTFSTNSNSYGSGVYDSNSDPNFVKCLFSGNLNSAALYNADGSEPQIKDCIFADNIYGAIYNGGHSSVYSPQVINSIFIGNSNGSSMGAAIECGDKCNAVITNCVFSKNTVYDDWMGVIFFGTGSNSTVTNCVFNSNLILDDDYSGVIYNDGIAVVKNCIIWGNTGPISAGGVAISFTYCDIEGGWSGDGNINQDPRFVDPNNPAGVDGIFYTDDDGLQVEPNSPCVDAGTDSGAPLTDIMGRPRVDIPYTEPDISLTDMGAYEVQIPVWHVREGATGEHGMGWSDALGYLQDALAEAQEHGGEIWVAAGIYKPDENSIDYNGTGNRDANFALIEDIGIYGGFSGDETLRLQQNPVLNETILSGNIDESGNDDIYHVVTAIEVNETAILSGFTITDGNANGTSFPYNCGGGIFDINASPTIADCNFKNNNARQYGGGIYNASSNPTITNCVFNDNKTTFSISYGGAIYNNSSTPHIKNCIFNANQARYGGGIYNAAQSSPTLTNSVFNGNAAVLVPGLGGAVYNNASSPAITNCVFVANSARIGGSIYNYNSIVDAANCTFTGNSTVISNGGGALYNANTSSFTTTNCIFWNDINDANGCTITLRYCDIQGGLSAIKGSGAVIDAGGNIDKDPCFADRYNPVGPDGIWFTVDDGLQLAPDINGNFCIDAGDGNAAPVTDGCGNERLDIDFIPNTGTGNPDYTDIGAYEYTNPVGYTTSFETYQGYESDPINEWNIDGVDGWGVEEGSGDITQATYKYLNDTYSNYKHVEMSTNSAISYNPNGPCQHSIVRISCIPSPGSYINIKNGNVNIASLQFGAGTDANLYVLDNGVYKKADAVPDYSTVATKCRDFLKYYNQYYTDPDYSYENTWIDFTIRFDWTSHTYSVSWTNYAVPDGASIYSGAKFSPYYSYYTKIEFITGGEYDPWNPKKFEINSLSLSDMAVEGGIVGQEEGIWLIAPRADLTEPLKGRVAIAGTMWFDMLGEYVIKSCPSDLDPNDGNSWMQVCSGRTVGKYPTTLGYWHTGSFYNGDYFLKIEIYDDLGRLHSEGIITIQRTFNGRTRDSNARYPVVGKLKPQTFTYEEYPDFKINWPGTFPFEFKRMYNSGMRSRLYPLFFGWTHNHNIRLIEDCSFDWITDESGAPVRDAKGLGVGRLWMNLPSGGGLFIGHIDTTDANKVIYEPNDHTNQRIERIANYINNPTTTSDVNATYVYYAPDGRKMTFNKSFTVGFPVPEEEGLIDWMFTAGIDRQEDRFGNALEYTWDGSEICIQEISNNRTPARLEFTYGLGGSPYLCSEVRLYPSNDYDQLDDGYVTFFGSINNQNTAYYETSRYDRTPGDDTASYYYSEGPEFKLTFIVANGSSHRLFMKPQICLEYSDEGAISKRQDYFFYYGMLFGYWTSKYHPIQQYNYEYDENGNLITTIDVKNAQSRDWQDDCCADYTSNVTSLRKEIIVTSQNGALISKHINTFLVRDRFDQPFDANCHDFIYEGLTPSSWYAQISDMGYHTGGGGATDVNYYYENELLPFKPTTIIEYFDDDGDSVYDRPEKIITMEYDPNHGNLIEQRVYVDDINYVLTEYEYHDIYDFPIRQTTWQGYCATGARVEKLWYYGDANGVPREDGKQGDYLVMESTLLDDTGETEQWADTNYVYYQDYPGGQIRQKTDPEGSITYYEYDVNGFIANEWQGATLDGYSFPTGNPQKRYYFDGLGQMVLEGDYLGKVVMNIYVSNGLVSQSRQYIDADAMSRENFMPEFYDPDIVYDNDPKPDWWTNRTFYSDYHSGLYPRNITLPTSGSFYTHYQRTNNGVYRDGISIPGTSIDDFDENATWIAVDNGRNLDEFNYYWDKPWSGGILSWTRSISVYDSMLRLQHKYSYYDNIRLPYPFDSMFRYIKHEEYKYDAAGNKIFEAVYNAKRTNDTPMQGVFESTLEKANSYEYDILNRLTEQIVDSNEQFGLKITTQFGYDAVGNRTYVVDPNGNVIFTDYDNANRKIRDYFAVSPVYFAGTSDINFIATREIAKVRKEVSYYNNGKIQDVNSYGYEGELLARSEYNYDSRGRIDTVIEKIDDVDEALTQYDYDDVGFERTPEDPCRYQIKITDAEGKNTWISMYPLGQPHKIFYPSGDYEEYIYYGLRWDDPNAKWNGLLEKKAVWDADGNKQYITYEYDPFGKISKVIYPDDGYLEYEYTLRTNGNYGVPSLIKDYRNDEDRPGSDVNDYGIYTFDYWYLDGKLRNYRDYDGYEVNYMYSAAYGQPTEIMVKKPNGERIYDVNYVYDRAGRLVDVCEPFIGQYSNLVASFGYDKNGNRSHLEYWNGFGLSLDYTYNIDNMLTGFNAPQGATFGFDALQPGDIDGLGRLRAATETTVDKNLETIQHDLSYQYDMRSQLKYASMTNVGGLDWVSDTYSYDKAGNVQNHTYDTSSDPPDETAYDFEGDLMMQAGDTAVDWDKNGNMTLKDDTDDVVLVYNWDNKLRSASYDGNSISIKYDPMGNRVLKYNNTTARKYIVDIAGGLPTILHELDPNNGMEVKRYYIYANGEVLMKHEGYDRYFYLHDRLGSVRQVLKYPSVMNSYTYGPFGEMIESECIENTENPFKFTCQYYDEEIGQYYLRARQYDPQLMRMTGRDPVDGRYEEPMTLHKYLYCLNDPIDYFDPTGESLESIAIGAEMYGQDLAAGGIALALTYAIIINNEIYQAMIESIVVGVTYEVDSMVNLGLDVLAATRVNAARKDVSGNIKQFNIHLEKFKNTASPNDPFKHWLKEMKTFVRNVQKAASRLKGKELEETLNQVDDMWKTLEELAKQHNLPWNN